MLSIATWLVIVLGLLPGCFVGVGIKEALVLVAVAPAVLTSLAGWSQNSQFCLGESLRLTTKEAHSPPEQHRLVVSAATTSIVVECSLRASGMEGS